MKTITFENGKKVTFNGNPTQADIEEVAKKLNIQKQSNDGVGTRLKEFGSGLIEDFKRGGQNVSDAVTRGGDNFYQSQKFVDSKSGIISPKGLAQSTGSLLSTGLQTAGAVAQTAGSVGGRVVSLFMPNFAKDTISNISNKVVNSDTGKYIGSEYKDFKESNPNTAENLEAGFNIASLAPIQKGATLTKNTASKAISKTGEVLTPIVNKTKEISKDVIGTTNELINKGKNIINPTVDTVVTKRQKQFTDLLNSGVKTKNLYDNVKSKGHDVVELLSKNNDFTPDIVDGRLIPDKAIISVQEKIKPMAKTVREVIDTENKSISFDQFKKTVLDEIEPLKNKGDEYNRIRAQILKDLDSYQNNFVSENNTIALSKLDDIKKAKYEDINWNKPVDELTANKAIASSARRAVEDNVSEISIKELNKELSKLYDVQDTLEALGGRAIKGGRLGKYFTTMTGSIAGGVVGGGGGSVVGYFTAEKIADMIQRGYFRSTASKKILERIKTEKPEIFNQANSIIESRKKPLQLKAPKSN